MTFPLCPVCNYPVRRRNRKVHKVCMPAFEAQFEAEALDESEVAVLVTSVPVYATSERTHECSFCHSTDTYERDGAWFCDEHGPDTERRRPVATITTLPERCERCGEALTPMVTKGKAKCACDDPSIPRPCKPDCKLPHMHRRVTKGDDRPPTFTMYR